MNRTLTSLVLVSLTLVLCGTGLSNEVFAQKKTLYTHRTTCVDGSIIQVPVVCTPNQQVTVTVNCPGEPADRITWRCPDSKGSKDDWLRFGLRLEGSYAQFQGPQDNRDIWSSDIFGVLQFPHFLGPLGFEASIGGGGSFFPNDDTAFHSVFEAGPVFDMGRYFQLLAGYRAELGTVTNKTVLQRHGGLVRLRWKPIQDFAVEAMFSPGWGLQVSESTHEEWEGDEGWKVTDVHNHAGWTPSVAMAVTWFIH